MADYNKIYPFTLRAEGGVSNDPLDPGGLTNHGITRVALAAFQGVDVSDITDARITSLSEAEAAAIYKRDYFDAINCGALNDDGLALEVFDFGITAGPRTSVRLLQEAIGVTADGAMGPLTIKTANNLTSRFLLTSLATRHENYYKALPGFVHDGAGWTSRVNACLAAAILLSGGEQPTVTPAKPKPGKIITKTLLTPGR